VIVKIKSLPYPLDRRLGGPKTRLDDVEKRNNNNNNNKLKNPWF
jgi:hypothetical protein